MLIGFTVANFRSFRERQALSMVASGGLSEHLKTNTFDPKLKGHKRCLRSAAIYGANASGKTNLLRALKFMQDLVLNSAAQTSDATYSYEPFKFAASTRRAPSEFGVTFAQNGIRYDYGFHVAADRVSKEWLIEYVRARGRVMFDRSYEKSTKKYKWKFSSFLTGQRSVWRDSTRPNALFLSTAIQLNSEKLRPVFEWFQKRLVIISGTMTLNQDLTIRLLAEPSGKERLLPFLREADLGITDLEVRREPLPSGPSILSGRPIIEHVPGSPRPNLVTVTFSHASDDNKEDAGLDLFDESSGTQILFKSAGAWLNVLKNGEVLLFDEIDTSLHPLLTRFLVQQFHSSAKNPNNAQLIFSTHDISLLDLELFRRDQVWFVEKGRNGASQLYPLTDFKPRKEEVLQRSYMRGRYGGLPLLKEVEG